MTLKRAIKEAITTHSPKWRAKKVWSIKVDGMHQLMSNDQTMWIEVTVVKKRKPKT
jgi:hypothetical protein